MLARAERPLVIGDAFAWKTNEDIFCAKFFASTHRAEVGIFSLHKVNSDPPVALIERGSSISVEKITLWLPEEMSGHQSRQQDHSFGGAEGSAGVKARFTANPSDRFCQSGPILDKQQMDDPARIPNARRHPGSETHSESFLCIRGDPTLQAITHPFPGACARKHQAPFMHCIVEYDSCCPRRGDVVTASSPHSGLVFFKKSPPGFSFHSSWLFVLSSVV